eukprot:COSAG02_NODE_27957_length_599_cov_1.086000_1_plen_46_part_10
MSMSMCVYRDRLPYVSKVANKSGSVASLPRNLHNNFLVSAAVAKHT